MDIQIGAPTNIWLLAIVAAGLILVSYAVIARRRAALTFATVRLRSQILPPGNTSRHWVSAMLIAASLSLLCLALMDIRWGKTWREVPQKGIEVMFVLDVSRSMLAEDVTPNRLSRAKQQIKDMIDEMAGDRIGLIVFAGETRQSVPLTSHYEDFQQTLDAVGPHTVRVGGSRLGDALEAASNGFISKTNDHKAIVVFTDGEDQESKPDEVAKKLHVDHGIRIFTVGLGDMSQGARIPKTEDRRGGFVQYDGQQVWSKLNGQILSQIATDTDGAYIPAGTRNVNMAEIYHGYVANVEQTEFETAKINAYIARYQWFAAPALVLLLLEVWISTRAAKTRKSKPEVGRTERSDVPADGASRAGAGTSLRSVRPTTTTTASYIAAALVTLSAASAWAQPPGDIRTAASAINAANTLLRDGKVDEALDAYRRIVPGEQQRDELNYNMAVAEYRKGNIEAAEKFFTEVAGTDSTTVASDSHYNLGNCQYAKALQLAEKDKPAAIELLRKAIANYRGALRGKPNNPNARANIELAGELIRKLEQEQKKEDQQQKQDDQQQQNEDKQQDQQDKDQQKQNEQKQQDKSKDSESQKDESQQDSDQQKSDSQDSKSDQQKSDQQKNEELMDQEQKKQDEQSATDQPQEDEQKKDEQKNDNAGDKEQKNDQQKPSEQQSQSKSSDSQQKQQQKSGDQEKPEDAGQPEEQDAKNKQVPTGDLKAASEREQNKQPDSEVGTAGQNAKDGLMTREEALKMLQSVRDRDMLRRMQQQRQERSRRVPVDKDW